MTSQITKLVSVPLEEWKRLNKNGVGGVGGGDTYTTIEIPSSKHRNQEGRGKNQEEKEELNSPPPISYHPALWDNEELGRTTSPLPPSSPPPSPPLLQKGKKGKERGGKEKEGGN